MSHTPESRARQTTAPWTYARRPDDERLLTHADYLRRGGRDRLGDDLENLTLGYLPPDPTFRARYLDRLTRHADALHRQGRTTLAAALEVRLELLNSAPPRPTGKHAQMAVPPSPRGLDLTSGRHPHGW